MKNIVLLLLISVFLISCSKSDDHPRNNPDDANYIVYPDSSLVFTNTENGTFIEVQSGNKLVFEYRYSTEGRPEIADDEFTEVVYFELDPATENFTINQDSFESTQSYLGKFCFCGRTGYFPITSGEINGEKTGSLQWRVSLDVNALIEAENNIPEMTFEANASGTFKPTN
ncbi:hypothetical protein [Gramella sp. MAR_2010_147]|uniref:hypothetical protein n=1 Tax=Gramella sp. MAR_2010_147 TaxID=1250205 RepID=UPI00087C599F|nr:hypothetical protein [Gramella sp. MAR_2010_147]SDS45406.1 hypothetical protein SAMN04488553_2293 [Gramella sp. MAR_2010_147]